MPRVDGVIERRSGVYWDTAVMEAGARDLHFFDGKDFLYRVAKNNEEGVSELTNMTTRSWEIGTLVFTAISLWPSLRDAVVSLIIGDMPRVTVPGWMAANTCYLPHRVPCPERQSWRVQVHLHRPLECDLQLCAAVMAVETKSFACR